MIIDVIRAIRGLRLSSPQSSQTEAGADQEYPSQAIGNFFEPWILRQQHRSAGELSVSHQYQELDNNRAEAQNKHLEGDGVTGLDELRQNRREEQKRFGIRALKQEPITPDPEIRCCT